MRKDAKESLTVGKILKELSPGQLWTVMGAVATIVAGAFTAGQHFDTTGHRSETNAVPCYQAKDWPKGTWLTWGHFDSKWKPTYEGEKFPQFSGSVVFTSNVEYTTATDEENADATRNTFKGTLEAPLQAGSVFKASGRTDGGYSSWQSGQVTDDGCMINVTDWRDSAGDRGSVHYLFRRDRYYVQR